MLYVYLAFVRNAFLKMLAYRARYYTGIFTYVFFVAVYYFIWKAVYAGNAAEGLINGYSLSDMLTYISVGWVARSCYFSNIDDEMDDLVRTGQISIYLLRPVNFQAMMFAQAAGESVFRALFFSVPIAVTLWLLFPIELPANLAAFSMFVLSTVLGFLVLAALNFLVGLLAFSFKSIDGIMRAKYNLTQLASGLLLPISFFPLWFQQILDLLPFKAIAFVPLQFYLSKIPAHEIGAVFASQFIWFAALSLLGCFFWSRAMARLTVQGG